MDPLTRINALVDFLRVGSLTLRSIVQFVTLDTFFEYGATTMFFNIVWTDGSVHIPAWYGCSQAEKDSLPERLVTMDTPMNEALRTGKIVECGSYEEYRFAGSGYAEKIFPDGFAYSIAVPVPEFGVLVTFCQKKTSLTKESEQFLRAVGGILSLHLSQDAYKADFKSGHVDLDHATLLALTQRQWTILGALRRGDTNAQIATELRVSESLVRQETVRIYRSLGVSGRKELNIEKASNL